MESKVFVITGSSGIAASTIRKLVEGGARVYFVGIDQESCVSLFAELSSSGRIAYQLGDVTADGEGMTDHAGSPCSDLEVAGGKSVLLTL